MRIASFDIGKKNFAFYIEEFDENKLKNLITQSQQNNFDIKSKENGELTEKSQELLNKIYIGKSILHHNIDLTKLGDDNNLNDIMISMTNTLDYYEDEFNLCDLIVIEEQMSFGKFRNPLAIRLAHHCSSYFINTYRGNKLVLDFHAYHKTQLLGCEKIKVISKKTKKVKYQAISKPQRKKWAIQKAIEICKFRNDETTLNLLQQKKKADDLADTFLQTQAVKFKLLQYNFDIEKLKNTHLTIL